MPALAAMVALTKLHCYSKTGRVAAAPIAHHAYPESVHRSKRKQNHANDCGVLDKSGTYTSQHETVFRNIRHPTPKSQDPKKTVPIKYT